MHSVVLVHCAWGNNELNVVVHIVGSTIAVVITNRRRVNH